MNFDGVITALERIELMVPKAQSVAIRNGIDAIKNRRNVARLTEYASLSGLNEMAELSRASQGEEKKTEAVTVKLSDTTKRFVDARFKQEGMESPGEYIRHLIELDRQQAADNFNLLAEALGVQINLENYSNVIQRTEAAFNE